MTKTEFEFFQRFMKVFDKWAKENLQKAFEFFTRIVVAQLADVKKISFEEKED